MPQTSVWNIEELCTYSFELGEGVWSWVPQTQNSSLSFLLFHCFIHLLLYELYLSQDPGFISFTLSWCLQFPLSYQSLSFCSLCFLSAPWCEVTVGSDPWCQQLCLMPWHTCMARPMILALLAMIMGCPCTGKTAQQSTDYQLALGPHRGCSSPTGFPRADHG